MPSISVYRTEAVGRHVAVRLAPPEFIRRFLIHALRDGFHRIFRYDLLASGNRKTNSAKADVAPPLAKETSVEVSKALENLSRLEALAYFPAIEAQV